VAGAPLPDVRAVSVNTSDKPKLAVADLLAQAKPAEHTIRLCLRGDLQAQFEELDRQRAEAASKTDGDSLAGSPAVAIARRMEALREEMDAATVTFTVRALSRKRYQALVAAHPPRRDEKGDVLDDDREMGVNQTTFWEPLIRACAVDPELTEDQWRRLLDDVLSDRQYEQLASAALVACRGNVDIPFSFAASELIRNFGGELNAPNGSASLSSGSTAGNPPPSMSTTTPEG
jgi:hypothetical protein